MVNDAPPTNTTKPGYDPLFASITLLIVTLSRTSESFKAGKL